MGRYKVKVWQGSSGGWIASLYEDPTNMPLHWTGIQRYGTTREDALKAIRAEREFLASTSNRVGFDEPEWVSLDDEVPEPQSLRAI